MESSAHYQFEYSAPSDKNRIERVLRIVQITLHSATLPEMQGAFLSVGESNKLEAFFEQKHVRPARIGSTGNGENTRGRIFYDNVLWALD